jgi:hypothetical protein
MWWSSAPPCVQPANAATMTLVIMAVQNSWLLPLRNFGRMQVELWWICDGVCVQQLNFVAVKMAKRLGAWQCDYLSSGGKSISIQSCLSSIPLYANGCVLCTSSTKKSKSGRQTRFWHDFWVGINPLKIEFWQLFQICSDPDIEVGKVWRENQWQISFRMTGRTAHGWVEQNEDLLSDVQTESGRDRWLGV